jgi:hypothetical protein
MANGLPNSTLREASNHRDAVTTGLSSTSFRVTSVDAKRFSLLAAAIFAIIAALQFVRALSAWPITLDTLAVPVWASWVAAVAFSLLAWFRFSASKV